MNNKRILWLSLLAGVLVEGALCGYGAMFAKFGTHGPENSAASLLMLIHFPAIQIAKSFLSADSSRLMPAVVAITTVMWTVTAFLTITIMKKARDGERVGK